MKLLILTPQFPFPPHQGTTLRNYNLIKGLAEKHTLDLFSMLAPGDDPRQEAIVDIVRYVVTSLQPQRTGRRRLRDLFTTPRPDMALRLWDGGAFNRLQQHIKAHPPDLIQIEGIEMAPYLLALAQTSADLPLTIYDAHNAETILQQRAFQADLRRPSRWIGAGYSAIQTNKLRRYEQQILQLADGIAAVSEADAEVLRTLAPGCVPYVITNGIDLHAYDPEIAYANPYTHAGVNLVFTGKMDFRPNVDGVLWFAERVLPPLHATNLNPHFWIVGRNPHARLQSLRSRPDITITGAVPDIQPYIAHADLYVVPLLAGGGTRLKILESLAMARPVVSTRLGADGFPVSDGEQLALADTPADFIQRCVALLQQPQEAAAMGERGRTFVVDHYSWDKIVPEMNRLYHRSKRWSEKSLVG